MNEKYIIVVDDERLVLSLISVMLRNIGYSPVEFSFGAVALKAYRDNYANIEMVIADLSMPEVNGLDMVKDILTINPNESIIIVTGLVKNDIKHKFPYDNVEILPKPFSIQELRCIVSRMMEAKNKRIKI
jgi:DNA-binding NtrC family response regulator